MSFTEYLEELADDTRPLRAARLPRLSHLDGEEKETFRVAWRGIEAGRRRQVLSQLADLAEDNVELNFDSVFLACLDDEDAEVRVQAIRGLWEYEGYDLIGPLLRILREDDDAAVRAEAALALGRFVVLWEFGRLRARYFEGVEEGLRRTLGDNKEVEEVRARALEAIGACGHPWVRQAISEVYENGRRRLKVGALHAMGRSCDGRWLPLLFRELTSEDPEYRYEAAVACGAIAEEAAVPHLSPLLYDDDAEVQAAAIAALGEIGGAQAKALLLSLAAEASPSVQEAVREALGQVDFDEDPLSHVRP